MPVNPAPMMATSTWTFLEMGPNWGRDAPFCQYVFASTVHLNFYRKKRNRVEDRVILNDRTFSEFDDSIENIRKPKTIRIVQHHDTIAEIKLARQRLPVCISAGRKIGAPLH